VEAREENDCKKLCVKSLCAKQQCAKQQCAKQECAKPHVSSEVVGGVLPCAMF
jgi:hypothetical protein